MAHYQNQYRKKGMMEKVREKLPCTGNKKRTTHTTTTHTTTATHGGTGQHGMVDKVMDKLPGTGPAHGTHTTGQRRQKKGIMGKIKAKLPGGYR